jgi:undecaprenyl-diphosphatase
MDDRLFRAINDLALRWHTGDVIGRFLATKFLLVFPVALALLWIFARGAKHHVRTAVIVGVAAAAIAVGANQIVNHVWHRARPYAHHHVRLLTQRSTDPSFPSDHTAFAFGMAAGVWPRARKTGWWLLLGGVLVALARVFVGAHYPGDVAAGAAMGIAASVLCWRALLKPLDALTTVGEWIWTPVDKLVERAR